MINNNCNEIPIGTTLADVFLDILERTGNAEQQDNLNRIRRAIQSIECRTVFDTVLKNALGYRTPIDERIVDRGVDCLIRHHKIMIDEDATLTNQEKEHYKQTMECYMNDYKIIFKNYLRGQNLLV